MNKKRVLIISCDPIGSNTSLGKTLTNQFKNHDDIEVFQFYTANLVPEDFNICKGFYRITDREIIKSKITFPNKLGEVIERESHVNGGTNLSISRRSSFADSNILRIARDLFWHGTNWSKKGLLDWVNNLNPNVIYFVGLNNPYLFRLSDNISKKLNIPIIIFTTDDYYISDFKISPFYWIRLFSLKFWFKRILKDSLNILITINPVMSKIYKEKFGRESIINLNYVELKEPIIQHENLNQIRIVFTGNISHNRWLTIVKLIEMMNLYRLNNKITLSIYSNEIPNKKFRRVLEENFEFVHFGGFISGKELWDVINDADVLLHVESFKKKDINLSKLSFSTKITEYISTGKPILAIGPSKVSSISVLKENSAAFVIDNIRHKNNGDNLLKLFDKEERITTAKNANIFLRTIYDSNNIPFALEKIIKKIG